MPTKSKTTTKRPVSKAAREIPRFQLGEAGVVGLTVAAGIPVEEMRRELQFPQSIQTFKEMSYDSTIASALGLFELFLAKSEWKVKAPEKATPEQKFRAKFIEQCMLDMKHSWADFITEAASMVTYGFSIHEKVYRRRYKTNGSRFDDGLIGWAKLPIRSQDSIQEFIYDDTGREVVAVKQNLSSANSYGFNRRLLQGEVIIPRKKFLHFRTGKYKENPVGHSPLRNVYFSWKYRAAIEEQEAIGVHKDLSGYPVMQIPPAYLSADATPEQKAIVEEYKKILRNLQNNTQAGLLLPLAYDPETKQPLFKFDLLGVQGGKSYNTTDIIRRYDNKILTALFADLLIMGQSSGGSYNLGSLKSNIMNLAIEARLQEIADVINRDLIPQTFELNGWEDEVFPQVYFDDLTEADGETFSKLVQRVASVGLVEKDRAVLNKIRSAMGVEEYPEDEPIHTDLLTGNTSGASEGMAKGSGNGTSDSTAGTDNSSLNLDNAA